MTPKTVELPKWEDIEVRPINFPHTHPCGYCGTRVLCDYRERQWFCGNVTNWDICPSCRSLSTAQLKKIIASNPRGTRTKAVREHLRQRVTNFDQFDF